MLAFSISECSGLLNFTYGTVESPRNATTGNYLPNLDCKWDIVVPHPYRVEIIITEFHVSSNIQLKKTTGEKHVKLSFS